MFSTFEMMSEDDCTEILRDSINSLEHLIQQERNKHESNTKNGVPNREIQDYYMQLYIKYIILLKNLDRCYCSFIHPQKRLDIKVLLSYLSARVVDLRYKIVRLNKIIMSPISLNSTSNNAQVCWENFDLHITLDAMKLTEKDIVIPNMAILNDEFDEIQIKRDTLVKDLAARTHYRTDSKVDDIKECSGFEQNAVFDNPKGGDFIPFYRINGDHQVNAVILIQKYIRGWLARNRYKDYFHSESECIGMIYDCEITKDINSVIEALQDQWTQRYDKRSQREVEYKIALKNLSEVVRKEEGYFMEEKLRSERIKWITEYIVQNKTIPESLDSFYEPVHDSQKYLVDMIRMDVSSENTKSAPKDKNVKKASTHGEHECTQYSSVQGPLKILDELHSITLKLKSCWASDSNNAVINRLERFSIDIAKNYTVREVIYHETKLLVDRMMNANLHKLRTSNIEKLRKEATDNKAKKLKAKKVTPFPGVAYEEIRVMGTSTMLKVLIEKGIVTPRESGLDHAKCQRRASLTPQLISASTAVLWNAVMSYCVLPLCSNSMRNHIDDEDIIRSILFYGPEGCGKAFMSQEIASLSRALFINMSPSLLNTYVDKPDEVTKVVHMIFTVAMDPSYAPVVIFLDECEKIFSKRKKGQSSELSIFLKDLLTYKNRALTKNDRVVIIGCTSNPDFIDINSLKWKGSVGVPHKQGFFERFLYFPPPDYDERCCIWRELLDCRLSDNAIEESAPIKKLNISILSLESDSCSVAEIRHCIDAILNPTRIKMLESEPISHDEFIEWLQGVKVERQGLERFNKFAREIETFGEGGTYTDKTSDKRKGKNSKRK